MTILACRSCGKKAHAAEETVSGGNEAFYVSSLPSDWIVFDAFPPGDSGLGFACSLECLQEFFSS